MDQLAPRVLEILLKPLAENLANGVFRLLMTGKRDTLHNRSGAIIQ